MTRAELRRIARDLGWRGAKAKRPGKAKPEVQAAFREAVKERLGGKK